MEYRAGDRVVLHYEGLEGVPAIVRKVMEDDMLSIRVAFRDIPYEERFRWMTDPHNPEYTPLVVYEHEVELFGR